MQVRQCVQCGKDFIITDAEIEACKVNKINLPTRCKDCRQKNAAEQQEKLAVEEKAANRKSNRKLILPIALLVLVIVFMVFTVINSNKKANPSINDTTASGIYSSYTYKFRSEDELKEHFKKHGKEVGAKNESEYVKKANDVINNMRSLKKTEASENDGDTVYFIENTGEIVFVSSDGYLRSYFKTNKEYFDRT